MTTLGMIITSDRYPNKVWSLAQAASEKNLEIRVHLTGKGVRLMHQKGIEQLALWASISVCSESARYHLSAEGLDQDQMKWLAEASQMTQLIEECDRHIFF